MLDFYCVILNAVFLPILQILKNAVISCGLNRKKKKSHDIAKTYKPNKIMLLNMKHSQRLEYNGI